MAIGLQRYGPFDANVDAILRWHVATEVDFLTYDRDKHSNKHTEEGKKQKKTEEKIKKEKELTRGIMTLQRDRQ